MPTFDYECKTHGVFEVFFEERHDYWSCPHCGEVSSQVWRKCPNVDSTAFAAWNPDSHSANRDFTDKARYRDYLKHSGSTPYESGMDHDAQQNNERILKDMEKDFRENVIGPYIQSHTLDELHAKIANEKVLMEAQMKGDVDTIRKMGGHASLDDAMKAAPKTPVQEWKYVKNQ